MAELKLPLEKRGANACPGGAWSRGAGAGLRLAHTPGRLCPRSRPVRGPLCWDVSPLFGITALCPQPLSVSELLLTEPSQVVGVHGAGEPRLGRAQRSSSEALGNIPPSEETPRARGGGGPVWLPGRQRGPAWLQLGGGAARILCWECRRLARAGHRAVGRCLPLAGGHRMARRREGLGSAPGGRGTLALLWTDCTLGWSGSFRREDVETSKGGQRRRSARRRAPPPQAGQDQEWPDTWEGTGRSPRPPGGLAGGAEDRPGRGTDPGAERGAWWPHRPCSGHKQTSESGPGRVMVSGCHGVGGSGERAFQNKSRESVKAKSMADKEASV